LFEYLSTHASATGEWGAGGDGRDPWDAFLGLPEGHLSPLDREMEWKEASQREVGLLETQHEVHWAPEMVEAPAPSVWPLAALGYHLKKHPGGGEGLGHGLGLGIQAVMRARYAYSRDPKHDQAEEVLHKVAAYLEELAAHTTGNARGKLLRRASSLRETVPPIPDKIAKELSEEASFGESFGQDPRYVKGGSPGGGLPSEEETHLGEIFRGGGGGGSSKGDGGAQEDL